MKVFIDAKVDSKSTVPKRRHNTELEHHGDQTGIHQILMNEAQLFLALRLNGDGNRLKRAVTGVFNQHVLVRNSGCVLIEYRHHCSLKC